MKLFIPRAISIGPLLIGILLSLETLSATAQDLILGVHSSYSNDYLKIGFNQSGYNTEVEVSSCPTLDAPGVKDIQRITMDILLICNAVRDAGIAERLLLNPYPNVTRGVSELEAGKVDMIAQTLFPQDHESINKLLKTDPIIRSGEFEVGVFTTENRHEILKINHLKDLQQRIGVTVQSWFSDQEAMERIGITHIELVPQRELIAKFIEKKRGDFTLSYLKEPVVTRIGGKLIRIPGIKVSFPQERAFLVSATRPQLYEALQSYIRDSRTQKPDVIEAAYIHAGFIAKDYNHWIDLSKEALR